MIVMAIDTCDARGSVAVLQDDAVLASAVHDSAENYSVWLLPAVEHCLGAAGITMSAVELYAVSVGPGSFTGVRMGLATVKAWVEVFEKPAAAVSRLAVLAAANTADGTYVAAAIDGHRGQVFGALYRRTGDGEIASMSDEMVIAPESFVAFVSTESGDARVEWVSTDPGMIIERPEWGEREARGEEMLSVSCVLAPMIGKYGWQKSLRGEVVDALGLDAYYVRRPDAEAFWKRVTAANPVGR
jgi:tRNA threonylcarbamoyladenosine biosynthesis protein TsaB